MTKLEQIKQIAYKAFDSSFELLKTRFAENNLELRKPVWDELCIDNLKNEEWRPVVGYEHIYEVSNYGRVKSFPKRENSYQLKILKQSFDNCGYLYFTLGGKKFKSHRLVGLSFIENPLKKKTINHKLGLKWLNAVFNLEWNTSGENQRHALDNGLKVPRKGAGVHNSIPIIQYSTSGKFIREWECMKQVEKSLSIDDSPISKCCKGDINYSQAYGFLWRFKKDVEQNGPCADLPESEIHIKNKPKFAARRKTNTLKKLSSNESN